MEECVVWMLVSCKSHDSHMTKFQLQEMMDNVSGKEGGRQGRRERGREGRVVGVCVNKDMESYMYIYM